MVSRARRLGLAMAVPVLLSGCLLLGAAASRPMLPLGTAKGYGQPYQPCTPGPLAAVPGTGPMLSQAFDYSSTEAQGESAASSVLVDYRIGGRSPLNGKANRVTVPSSGQTLHVDSGVRLFIDGGGLVCISRWRVSARPLGGFDGTQEAADAWRELGAGKGQGDAVVVGGVDDGSWIVHVHLEFGKDSEADPDALDAYARVETSMVGAADPSVPAPGLVAACAAKVTPVSAPPTMVLSADGGATWTPAEAATQVEGSTVLAAMPSPVVQVAAGSLLRMRTADGSCGNDWGSAFIVPVPVDPALIGWGFGLLANDGGDVSALPDPKGGVNAIAPAPGEWVLGSVFWFGDRFATTYAWRISVH